MINSSEVYTQEVPARVFWRSKLSDRAKTELRESVIKGRVAIKLKALYIFFSRPRMTFDLAPEMQWPDDGVRPPPLRERKITHCTVLFYNTPTPIIRCLHGFSVLCIIPTRRRCFLNGQRRGGMQFFKITRKCDDEYTATAGAAVVGIVAIILSHLFRWLSR
jgi:hypothetical protein